MTPDLAVPARMTPGLAAVPADAGLARTVRMTPRAPSARSAADDAALAARLRRAVARHPPDVGPARGHRCECGTHSRAGDGRIVCWSVPPADGERFAVDAERADAVLPPALARRWSRCPPGGLVPAWTATEVVAKLTDTPVLLLARRGPVTTGKVTAADRRIVLWHEQRAGLHLCLGLSVAR